MTNNVESRLIHLGGRPRARTDRHPVARDRGVIVQERERYRRRAPYQVSSYHPVMEEIFTTSPVCGEWMNWLPPM